MPMRSQARLLLAVRTTVIPNEEIQNHVHRAAANIKIQDILDHSLHSLSYGMRQKVAIGIRRRRLILKSMSWMNRLPIWILHLPTALQILFTI